MTLGTYEAPAGADSAVAITLRNLGDITPEPIGGGMLSRPGGAGARTRRAGISESIVDVLSPGSATAGRPITEFVPPPNNVTQGHVASTKLTAPLLVRVLPGAALYEPEWYGGVTVAGWRYLLPDEWTAIDFRAVDRKSGKITAGPLIRQLVAAANVADLHFGRDKRQFRVGILEVPTLRVEALTIEDDQASPRRTVEFIVYKDAGPVADPQLESAGKFAGRLADRLEEYEPRGVDASNLRLTNAFEFPPPPAILGSKGFEDARLGYSAAGAPGPRRKP